MNQPNLPKKFNPHARHNARHYAVQALYQWHFVQTPFAELYAQFASRFDLKKVDAHYFHQLIQHCLEKSHEFDELIKPHLSRALDEIDPVELAILRLSCYELRDCLEIPYRVVINEALELTKCFGATDGFKFVNGVLDKLALALRSIEVNAGRKFRDE
ncbi:MAG: transcription antitermination factor NusB [Legionellales bacterium]|nr:transcription antitermination factor NusB [Legionellales bacterium]